MDGLPRSSLDDTRLFWERFDRDGVCWIRMAGAAELAQEAPDRLAEVLCGGPPYATRVHQITGAQAPLAGARDFPP